MVTYGVIDVAIPQPKRSKKLVQSSNFGQGTGYEMTTLNETNFNIPFIRKFLYL